MPSAIPDAAQTAFIGLGSNLGDSATALHNALAALDARADTSVVQTSPFYRSAPVDATGPEYLNAVAQLRTTLAPQALLEVLQALEHSAGRERPYRNAPRTLDLDLLLVGDEQLNTPTLTLPHPRMFERAFVLLPLADICPACVTPAQLASVAGQVIERCGDTPKTL